MINKDAFLEDFQSLVDAAKDHEPLAAAAMKVHPPATPEQEVELAGIIDKMIGQFQIVIGRLHKLRAHLPK